VGVAHGLPAGEQGHDGVAGDASVALCAPAELGVVGVEPVEHTAQRAFAESLAGERIA
jgi:hypothetical protein